MNYFIAKVSGHKKTPNYHLVQTDAGSNLEIALVLSQTYEALDSILGLYTGYDQHPE